MKILLTSDWHIKETYRGREGRLKDFLLLTNKLIEVINEKEPDYIFFLGDLFHTLSPYIRKDVLNFGKEMIEHLAEKVERFFILVGNHDMWRKESYLNFLDERPKITVISSIEKVDIGKMKVVFVPYGFPLPKENGDILCLHTDVKGAVTSGGKVLEEGIERVLGYDFVFNGHIHKPQNVNGIICVGSPLQHDFSEEGEKRRVILWNDGKMEDIWIEGLPSFRRMEVTYKKQAKQLLSLAESSDDYFEVTVPVGFDISVFEGYNRVFFRWKQISVEVEEKEKSEPISFEDAVIDWLKRNSVEEKLIPKVMEEVKNVWEVA